MSGRPPLRRGLQVGGIFLGALSAAHAQSPGPDYVVFTEYSPQNRKLLPGWNRRTSADTDSHKGNSFHGDFAARPTRLLLERQAGSNPQDVLLRVFAGNSKWHAVARLAIRRLP